MSRSLRILYPNAWYHILNRGASRVTIFHDNSDYQIFLNLLAQVHSRYQFEIHAYCLMPNHYHLLIRTPLANLSNGMRHLDSLYTVRHNKKYHKDGALLRGRYKSILVDAENYLLALSRYIHLNPINAGLTRHPAQYHWSSYRFYNRNITSPDWLSTNHILSHFGSLQQKNKYSLFVMKKTDRDLEKFYKKTKLPPILGSDAFRKQVSKTYLQNKKQLTNIPQYKNICRHPSLSQITEAVATYYRIPIDVLYKINRLQGNQPRSIAIYLATEISSLKFKIIADFFQNISESGISQIIRRTNKLISNKTSIANDIANLRKFLLVE